jgi:undecaprenyl diphosphate synthase
MSVYDDQSLVLNKHQHSGSIPQHVAVIMDGNRRWAIERNESIYEGHRKGADTLKKIIDFAQEIGVKTFTAFAFSTENWKRPSFEVVQLMWLFEDFLQKQRKDMVKKGIRFHTIGNSEELPDSLRAVIDEVTHETKDGKGIDLVLAINYGSRDEIVRASIKLAAAIKKGEILEEEVDEKCFASFLDTASWKEPDLLIRTSGEMRLSNFLLWQLSYAEVYISPVMWPDFNEQCFLQATSEYQKRNRRMGKG